MTSNMIYTVALGVGLKCPRKIHLNTQCPPSPSMFISCSTSIPDSRVVHHTSYIPKRPQKIENSP